MAIKLEGRRGKALMALQLVEDFFLRLPLGKTHIKKVFFSGWTISGQGGLPSLHS
jgi:hypothetical protein